MNNRLDIKGIENVINYEMPRSIEIYLHRVGRTARAGKKGRLVFSLPFLSLSASYLYPLPLL